MKNSKNIIIVIMIIFSMTILSYFMFISGTTKKINANIKSIDRQNNNVSYYPRITFTSNSSGEELVNTDVAIIINAESNYNITDVYYSFDNINWKRLDKDFNSKNIEAKLVFDKNINTDLYVKVYNEIKYSSYAYKTIVKIDKQKPEVGYLLYDNNILIKASDNIMVKKIQYSNDKVNWETIDVSEKEVSLKLENPKFKYIRSVDSVGNISKVKTID